MTIKTLTDYDGDTLRINPWRNGGMTLTARQDGKHAEVGPFDPADLIAAIREVAGETCCDAASPGNGYLCARERGHITEHVAMTMDGEVCDTWPVETDDKPEPAPAPSKSLTADDFAKERYLPGDDEVRYGYITTRTHSVDVSQAASEFDRFIARVRRDAEAAVLREAAEYMNDDQDAQYLVDCARDIEETR